jgi:2-polyprenyl-6-methoxyphenol hydroxylase-like FAD-dependent oxidoreductase
MALIYDVVIAGAGPVGLFLACELRLAHCAVLVLEQAEDPASPLKRAPFGRRGLWVSTIDAFSRRGLLDDVLALQLPMDIPGRNGPASAQARRPGGHFAGIQFFMDQVDTSAWPYHLPGHDVTSLSVDMASLEGALTARAEAMGVDIRRGVAVERFESSSDGVAIHAAQETFRGRWLVGCDGGRSTVRKAGGFDFTGTEPEFTGYSVMVELTDADALRLGRHYTPTGMYNCTRPGTIMMVEFDGGAFHRTQVTQDHVQAVLRRVTGIDVTVTALRLATTWTDRAFQATTYRKGRVLLAGDAAHIHSPLGGQGLNLGLGDATNLGWKLAAVIRGDVSEDLLDTYTSERHPIGTQILDWSRAQVALMRPSRSSRALEAIIRDLIATRDGATYFAERVWGVSQRYDLGDDHPLVGRSAPEFTLSDGRRLGDLLRAGRGVMLDFEARAPLRDTVGRWGGRIDYVASDAKDALGLSAVLVRPDGVVAWVAEGAPNLEEVADAASRWFGNPGRS